MKSADMKAISKAHHQTEVFLIAILPRLVELNVIRYLSSSIGRWVARLTCVCSSRPRLRRCRHSGSSHDSSINFKVLYNISFQVVLISSPLEVEVSLFSMPFKY